MKTWRRYCAGFAVAVGAISSVNAQQFPGIPSPTPVPPAPVATAAQPATLWQWLGVSKEQKEQCRQWLCQTQFGLLLNNGMAPVNMFSGGVIPSLCPGLPTAAELNSSNPAIAAAAAIKKSEAEAKARRAAVRYLSTVSCHYWPDAADALITALMFDENECVRWEAAMALGTGCCCTKATIEALAITASGSKKKGAYTPQRTFTEKSERVKAAAEAALYHCLECYKEVVPAESIQKPPEEQPKPEGRVTAVPANGNVQLAAFYAELDRKPFADVITDARKVLEESATRQPNVTTSFTTGNRNMFQIVANSMHLGNRRVKVFGMERPAPEMDAPPIPEPPSSLYQAIQVRREGIKSLAEVPAVTQAAPPAQTATTVSVPASSASPAAVSNDTTVKPAAGSGESLTATEPPLVNAERQAAPPAPVFSPPATSVPSQQGWVNSNPGHPTQQRPAPQPKTAPTSEQVSSAYHTMNGTPKKTTPVQPVVHQTFTVMPVNENSATARDRGLPSVAGLLIIFQDSPESPQRQWAVQMLARQDWSAHGEVVPALLAAARKDPDRSVRVTCIRCLTARNVNTPPVLAALRELQSDADPRVQQEATEGLVRLNASASAKPQGFAGER